MYILQRLRSFLLEQNHKKRLKSFNVLGGRFCHGKGVENKLRLHQTCFEAECILVQYDLAEHGLMEMKIIILVTFIFA